MLFANNQTPPQQANTNTLLCIYPNPASSQLNIEYSIPENQTAQFILYDVLGREHKHFYLSGKVKYMNTLVNDLPRGIYSYKFVVGNQVTNSGKVVLE